MQTDTHSLSLSLQDISSAIATLLLASTLVFSGCSSDDDESTLNLPSDEAITQTVATQFESADEIPASNIRVETKNGIVTLNGTTSNLLAKKRATEIAESINGVLSVVNNIKVTASRNDDAIEKDVAQTIATDPATETWKISSSVQNGMVTLKGTVESWQEKQLVEAILSGVKGVTGINNNIVVTKPADVAPDEIASEVERTLLFDSRIGDNMIKVSVDEDTVNLGGAVGSAAEKRLAISKAHVEGVDSVRADRLEVHPEYTSEMLRNELVASLEADEIKNAIENAFKYDPRVPADQITVTVKENRAILEGTVENLNSKLAAGDDARNTVGINTVENNISVERKVVVTPEVPTTDEAIQNRIEEGVLRDPYVNTMNLEVEVAEGYVVLKGEVDSEFKKKQVEKIANNVKGVIAVDNQVEVVSSDALS